MDHYLVGDGPSPSSDVIGGLASTSGWDYGPPLGSKLEGMGPPPSSDVIGVLASKPGGLPPKLGKGL